MPDPSPDRSFRCSDAARLRADELAGTAPPATRWLLIEDPGAWPRQPMASSGLSAATQLALQAAADRAGARLLTVRRPVRRGSMLPGRRQWFVLGRGSVTRQGSWAAEHDLHAAVDALDAPARAGVADPLILVCTHGSRDVCCAIRGRPVAAALAERYPEATWECTHVGGCRFAPNVVVLPDGAYYGDVDADLASEVIGDHLAGRVRTDHLRGYSGYPPAVQAAMIAVIARLDPDPRDLPQVIDVHGDQRTGWQVLFRARGRQVRVTVVAERADEARLTCRALRPSAALTFRLTAFDDLDPSAPAGMAEPI